MHFKAFFVSAMVATTATATAIPPLFGFTIPGLPSSGSGSTSGVPSSANTPSTGLPSNPFNPFPASSSGNSGVVPGYPSGIPNCLNDNQANFLAEQFRSLLAGTDRQKVNATAQVLMANTYTETSDSINILAGYPLGGVSFNNKQAFIAGLLVNPGLPGFTTVKVFHDCTNVLWQWKLTGLGRNTYEVKGFNSFVANPLTGVIQSNNLEFNSIAWGTDIGWTCTPPSGGQQ